MTQVTRQMAVSQLTAYLEHKLTLAELVHWAEESMKEGEFEADHFDEIREVASRLGVADVQTFGLTWEDCEGLLKLLGYRVRVEVVAVA